MPKHALIQLRNEPYSFELHCAMQLVKHEAAILGKRPAVTFLASLLPTYQQADIVEVRNPIAGKWTFSCDLPALSGGQGVMPRYSYSESLKVLFEQGNYALVDFFNGFNNRYYRLHCQTELKNNLTPIDVLFAGLPAGTVSGAPKIRALEILEKHEDINREFYSGSVFYLDANGDMDSCINLRTAMIKNKKIYAQSGAGIVFDSIPENEHSECINKANALFEAYNLAHNI